MKIIACAGQLAGGKDSLSDHLVSRLNEKYGNWVRASFANHVKRIVSETFGVSREFIEHWKRIDTPAPGLQIPMREALTFVGDGFRRIKPTIWMDLLLGDRKQNYVLSDCRYINELERIRKEGGITILIWRPGHENNIPNASEQELVPLINKYKDKPSGPVEGDVFDFFVRNNSSLEDLFVKADKIILPYIEKRFRLGE